jgi:hypothetical protein
MRKPMRTERLLFTVNLWDEDESGITQVLAMTSSLALARAVFDIAVQDYPDRMVTLLGPGALEVRAPSNAAWGCETVQLH